MKFESSEIEVLADAIANRLVGITEIDSKLPTERLGYPESEAAQLLGIPKHVLRDARLRGEISANKIGKCYVYDRTALLRLIRKEVGNE